MSQLTIPIESVAVTGPVDTNLHDGVGNPITSQVNGTQQALDVGINVAGVQIDPRDIRPLTSGTDSVSAVQSGAWSVRNQDGTGTGITSTLVSGKQGLDVNLVNASIPVTQSGAWNVTVSNLPASLDVDYGTVGTDTLRTAAQIGNDTGAAAFDTGNADAQTLRVVIADDQPSIDVDIVSGTITDITAFTAPNAALSSVALSVTTVAVLSSNSGRRGLILVNDSNRDCYIAFAATASTSAYSFLMTKNSTYFMDKGTVYSGAIAAIWGSSGTGNLRVTELT
jgi:hypothetical protein